MTREGKLERAVRAARGAGRPRPLLPARPARPRPLLGAEVLGGLGVRAFGGDGRWAPGARMCTRVQTLPCAHTPGSRVKVDPKSDPVWARVPECKCSARRGARFGGWGRPCTGGVGTRGWLSPQTEDHPHDPSHCSPPFSAGGGKGRGMRAAPSDSREADFPPTGVPSPLFASRIPGGPKSLGRPLHWVLNPQPPRPASPPRVATWPARAAPTAPRPCPSLRRARRVKNPNQAQERPRPARPAHRLPSRWVRSGGARTPARSAGRDPPDTVPRGPALAGRGRRRWRAPAVRPGARAVKGRGLLGGFSVPTRKEAPDRRGSGAGDLEQRTKPKAFPGEMGVRVSGSGSGPAASPQPIDSVQAAAPAGGPLRSSHPAPRFPGLDDSAT